MPTCTPRGEECVAYATRSGAKVSAKQTLFYDIDLIEGKIYEWNSWFLTK